MSSHEELFKRFISNEFSRLDLEELLAQFSEAGNETELREIILDHLRSEKDYPQPEMPDLEEKELVLYLVIKSQLAEDRTFRLWPRIAVAASLLFILSFGGYFLLRKPAEQPIVQNQFSNIRPGGNKAILTLANGKKIILNDAGNGKLAQQQGIAINKKADGVIVYSSAPSAIANSGSVYNMMTTPRGGQYQLILADGTKVWLNAASSLKYPNAFTGNDRDVELTGEAYFEVAKNKRKPFKVHSGSQTIQVLGTHFNVNAYADEGTLKTTLLEGKVMISASGESAMLSPGQQAQFVINSTTGNSGSFIHVLDNVDIEEAVAWKNGLFVFENTNIKSVMLQLSRWYDAQVIYKGVAPQLTFTGVLPKSNSIDKAVKLLEGTGRIKLTIDAKTIIVEKLNTKN